MEAITQKIKTFLEALATLEEGVKLFYEYNDLFDKEPTEKNEQLLRSMRDSMIQRFEYCTDLFWKITKIYLEDVEKVVLSVNSPRGVLREAVKTKILSETEGDICIDMVESRNKTSHIYHEITAEEIAHEVPGYYSLMKEVVDRLRNKSLSY